ncbi:MAG: efflux RND transporter periplasmic adaptor subunit [Gemmatimonadaceae bacterium]
MSRDKAIYSLLVLAVLTACSKEKDEKGDSAPTAVGVRTAVVTIQPFFETLGSIGVVEPRIGHVALLSAPAPTRVIQVFVSAGQNVSRGSTLVVLDQSSLRESVRSAAAALTAAQRSYERARSLTQAGILPRKDLEQATADLAKARADVATERRLLELSVLRSPISGIVTKMNAVLGAAVDTNQPLVEISDPTAVDIVMSVGPTEAATVHPGAKVNLRSGEKSTGEMIGVGTVIDVAGTVDSASRSVSVRIRAATTRRPLRLGETVYGEITLSTREDAVTAPLEALVPDGEGFKLFVVDPKGIVHSRPVVVGGRTDKIAEIKSGLSGGETVVTYGAYGLEDSVKVVVQKK